MAEKRTINIDMDLRCPQCKKKGAVQREDGTPGLCLACVLKMMKKK